MVPSSPWQGREREGGGIGWLLARRTRDIPNRETCCYPAYTTQPFHAFLLFSSLAFEDSLWIQTLGTPTDFADRGIRPNLVEDNCMSQVGERSSWESSRPTKFQRNRMH